MLKTKQTFGLGDIRSVKTVCENCGCTVAFCLHTNKFPSGCPGCTKGWRRDDGMEKEKLLFDTAYEILSRKNGPGGNLLFEIDAPERG